MPNKSPDATRVGALRCPFRFHKVRLSSVAGASAPALAAISSAMTFAAQNQTVPLMAASCAAMAFRAFRISRTLCASSFPLALKRACKAANKVTGDNRRWRLLLFVLGFWFFIDFSRRCLSSRRLGGKATRLASGSVSMSNTHTAVQPCQEHLSPQAILVRPTCARRQSGSFASGLSYGLNSCSFCRHQDVMFLISCTTPSGSRTRMALAFAWSGLSLAPFPFPCHPRHTYLYFSRSFFTLGSVWYLNFWPQLEEQVLLKDPCRLGFGPPHTGHLPSNNSLKPTGGVPVSSGVGSRFTVCIVRACGLVRDVRPQGHVFGFYHERFEIGGGGVLRFENAKPIHGSEGGRLEKFAAYPFHGSRKVFWVFLDSD